MGWFTAGGVGMILGLAMGVAGVFLPPLNIPTHEFSQAFTVYCAIIGYFWSGHAYQTLSGRRPGAPSWVVMRDALARTWVFVLAMALGAFAVTFVANELFFHCRCAKGAPFFWMTWPPTALLFSVLGIASCARRWGWFRRSAFVGALILVSVLHDWLQVLAGVRITDPIIGLPLAFDQRSDMDLPAAHFLQRAMTLLLASALWYGLQWRVVSRSGGIATASEVRDARAKALVAGGLATLILTLCPSYVGYGWGQGALLSALSETRESEHFVFHYAPGEQVERAMDRTVRFAEWNWSRICGTLQIAPQTKVAVFITENVSMQRELTGFSAANAMPGRLAMTQYEVLTSILTHELTHALDTPTARHEFSRAEKVGVALSYAGYCVTLRPLFYRGEDEGLAMALENHLMTLPAAHARQATALAEGRLPHAWEFMGFNGFKRVPENDAYEMAGSFMGFLTLRYGVDKLKEFRDRRNDYRAVYGKDLHDLDLEWRGFLSSVVVAPESRLASVESFQTQLSPAYNTRTCPKLGSVLGAKPLENLAWEQAQWGNYDAALSTYGRLYESSHEKRFRIAQAQMLRELDRAPESIRILDDLIADDKTPAGQRLLCAREKRFCLVKTRQWEQLYALLDVWSSYAPQMDRETQALHTTLRDTAQRETVAKLLVTRDIYEARRLAEDLKQRFPSDTSVHYVYLARSFTDFFPPWGKSGVGDDERRRVDTALECVRTTPGIADKLSRNLLLFAARAVESADFEFATRIAEEVGERAELPQNRYLATLMLGRIAFERAYHAEHKNAAVVATSGCADCATTVIEAHAPAGISP